MKKTTSLEEEIEAMTPEDIVQRRKELHEELETNPEDADSISQALDFLNQLYFQKLGIKVTDVQIIDKDGNEVPMTGDDFIDPTPFFLQELEKGGKSLS